MGLALLLVHTESLPTQLMRVLSHDPELLQHYNVFSTPEELRHSYAAAMALVRHRRLQYPERGAN